MPTLGLCTFFLVSLIACSQAVPSHLMSGPASRFDVNDVAILFPLPNDEAAMALLPTPDTFGGLTGPQLGTMLFSVKVEDEHEFNLWRLKDWHVVAMRFDPCQKAAPTDEACTVELRLVLQPLRQLRSGMVLTEDNALHLIYRHAAATGDEIARELYQLKQDNNAINTNGVPLGVHPIMSAQGLDGDFAQGIRQLFTTYAREEFLVEATVMVVVDNTDWRFGRTTKRPNGELLPAGIPFVASLFETLFGTNKVGGDFNEIRPAPTGPDHLAEMVDSDSIGAFWQLPETRQAELTASALRVDNPLKHTPSTVDCVSCHMASRTLTRVHGRDFLYQQDGNPDRFTAPANVTLTNTTDVNELQIAYAVRNFGYGFFRGGNVPALSQRVINDAARSAAILNAKLNL